MSSAVFVRVTAIVPDLSRNHHWIMRLKCGHDQTVQCGRRPTINKVFCPTCQDAKDLATATTGQKEEGSKPEYT